MRYLKWCLRRSRRGAGHVTCADLLVDARFWDFALRAGPSSATCLRRKTALRPGLLPNELKITADLARKPSASGLGCCRTELDVYGGRSGAACRARAH